MMPTVISSIVFGNGGKFDQCIVAISLHLLNQVSNIERLEDQIGFQVSQVTFVAHLVLRRLHIEVFKNHFIYTCITLCKYSNV